MSQLNSSILSEKIRIVSLVLLRISIGWHFLYEGLIKIVNPEWSSAPYLLSSRGPFSNMFIAIGENEKLLAGIDFLNEYALIIIGFSLMVGLVSRYASFGGMFLLLLYYLACPPFIGIEPPTLSEGNYLFVNKVMIEFFALLVLSVFPTDKYAGISNFIKLRKEVS